MTTNANWTIVLEDKTIIKNNGAESGTSYKIDEDSFWSDSKFSNIWAIQSNTSNTSDEVESRDTTPHSSFADANIGDISQFTNKWDSAHLVKLQSNWDSNNGNTYDLDGSLTHTETEAEKITRLGARPTSYSS